MSRIIGTNIHLSTTWYLQALVLALPVYITVWKSLKNRQVVFLVIVVLYYRFLNDISFPFKDEARVFAGLAVGGLCYIALEYIENKKIKINKNNYIMFQVLAVALFMVPFIYSYFNVEKTNIFVFCFFGSVLLSNVKTVDACAIFKWCSKLSSVIYIFHWSVGTLIYFVSSTSYKKTVMIYYFATLATSVVYMVIDEFMQRKKTRILQQLSRKKHLKV